MKATLSTRAIEILITKCNPLSLHTPKVDGSLIYFEVCISQSLVAPSVIQTVYVLSLQTRKYFPWIIFSPNHNSFQLLISARSSRCLDSSSHMLLWLLGADISAAPIFWLRLLSIWASPPPLAFISASSTNTIGPRKPLKQLLSPDPWDASEWIAVGPHPTL